jgi:tRNA pseudouridine38-40 synthase
MPRFKITLEYDGSQFNGWQVQKDQPTIQGKFFEVCKKVFDTEVFEFYGAGRTDAGVHALEQVAHLDVKTLLQPNVIQIKMNDLLPSAINILSVEKAKHDFHARHDAVVRSYVYQISTRRTAFGKRYCWWIKDHLNVQKMADAGLLFEGFHDFSSFGSKDADSKSTKVELRSCRIFEIDGSILIHITGSHFLWKMVRRMVGILVEIGRGNIPPSEVEMLLNEHSDVPAKFTAPPSGLFLERIYYQGDDIGTEPMFLLNIFK